jgi:hypothetical protein
VNGILRKVFFFATGSTGFRVLRMYSGEFHNKEHSHFLQIQNSGGRAVEVTVAARKPALSPLQRILTAATGTTTEHTSFDNFCRILTMVCWYWTNCTFGLYPSSSVSKNWGIKGIQETQFHVQASCFSRFMQGFISAQIISNNPYISSLWRFENFQHTHLTSFASYVTWLIM